jgi:hypothetical protein
MSRRIVSAALIAVCLVSGASGPAGAADLCSAAKFECNGFEPNWQFTTGLDGDGEPVVRFLDPENPGWEQGPLVVSGCVLQGSPNDFEVTTDAPVSLVANIVGQSCTEPNGDLTDYSVTVTYTQGALSSNPGRSEGTGCCTRLD